MVAVLGLLGLLGGLWPVAAPAEAQQSTLWSATLTLRGTGLNAPGCSNDDTTASERCNSGTTLTDNDFSLGGVDYEITDLYVTASGLLSLVFDKSVSNELKTYVLHAGSSQFALSSATISHSGLAADALVRWSSSGLTWTVGSTVQLSLRPPTATTTTTAATATTTTTAPTTATTVAVSPGVVGDGAPFVPFGVVPHVTAPRAPAAPTLVAGAGQLGVSWAPPEAAGEPLVACWVLGYSDDDGRTWTTVPHAAPTISGLKGGQRYLVRVAARVGGILGRWSPPAAATPTAAEPATPTTAATPAAPPPTDAATAPGDGDPPAAPGPPGPPEGLTITPGPGRLEVSWTPPEDQGGAPLLGYAVEYATAGTFQRWPRPGATDGATTATISGLVGDAAHRVRVGAVGCDGVSDWTPTIAATPAVRPPQAPTAPAVPALVPGDGRLAVTWAPPADDGGAALTGYRIEYSSDGGHTWTPQPHTGPHTTTTTITGLLGDRPHRVRVSATNTAGHGEPSPAATATPTVAPPDRPATPTVTPGPRQLTITWTAPDHNGAPIEAYTVEYSTDQGHTWTPWPHTGTHTTTTITDLTTGHRHQIRLTATNTAGTSPPTPPHTAQPH